MCHRCLQLLHWLYFTLITIVIIKPALHFDFILSPHSNKIITLKTYDLTKQKKRDYILQPFCAMIQLFFVIFKEDNMERLHQNNITVGY